MKARHVLRPLALACLVALAACSGGGGTIGGGIGGTSSVRGTITGFGSVIVGGIEFDTDGATVIVDGGPATVADLKLGMVASVRGTVLPGGTRGVAERVVSDALVQGPIQSIDVAAGALTILEQRILTDASTVFDPVARDRLAAGEIVRVSGFPDAQGRVRATRVERRPPDDEIEVKGTIRALDRAARRFRLESLIVDFADALIEGAPDGLQDGLFVEVEGDGPPVGGVLTALGVDVIDPALMADPGDGVKVEGFVTAIVSDDEIVVSGQRVRIDADTRFENGRRDDLVLDAEVDVTGEAESDGALRATEVELVRG